MSEYAFEGAKRGSTTITWSFETQTYAADQRSAFSSQIDPIYQGTVRAAFARWASVSALQFVESADAATNAIRLGFGNFTSTAEIGETAYSFAAGVLRADTVIRLLDPKVIPLTLINGVYYYAGTGITLFQVLLHEIGHALGLAHDTDPLTIMAPVATPMNADLAAGDVWGINTLYPLYTVAAASPVQVEGNAGVTPYRFVITRYSDPASALTITYAVTGAASPALTGSVAATAGAFGGAAFPRGQVSFAAGSTTATLTINVAGDTVVQADRGFAFTLGSLNASDRVTTRGTTSAIILDDDGNTSISANTVGVYRFFSTVDGTHFFTASQQERNVLIIGRADLAYEGPTLTAIANPAADPAASAVFRFFDTIHGTHFYTASTVERDATISARADLAYEGVGFYEHATAQAGDTPVYRFFDAGLGTHFYTASRSEHDSTLATRSDLVDEGIGFYAPKT